MNKSNFVGFLTVVIVCAIFSIVGIHLQFVNHLFKDIWGDTMGLKYHVVLYAADGQVLREWHVQTKIDDGGSSIQFYDTNNNRIVLSGTYVLEQE